MSGRHEVRLGGLLQGDVHAPALVSGGAAWNHGRLAEEVDQRRLALGRRRRLVALEARSDLDTIATYLAAFEGGHPVLLLAPDDAARHPHLLEHYRPDLLLDSEGLRGLGRSGGELHPDLALLMSTSGSTGSPKTVRLSRSNVLTNADSIAAYLGLTPRDRGVTTLPLHYCYGLSVLHSHLRAGASVVLTDLSVVDECFWELLTRTQVTGLAGVPYTYDQLDQSGFAARELPNLRYLTQAGGRMPPEQVIRYAQLGRERGFDLFVMYGQTEATARMAYLPPDLALDHPTHVGVPVPGGSITLAEVAEGDSSQGVGEIVYRGPNVMMGYASRREDLARGATCNELRTGDLGRRGASGLWEVVGRRDRVAKVYGLRLDLDRIEQRLTDQGHRVRVVALEDRLHLFMLPGSRANQVRAQASDVTTLPHSALRTHRVERFPLTANDKPDHAALIAHAEVTNRHSEARTRGSRPGRVTDMMIRDVFAEILGRPDASTADSFVSLRGDSLSYVEVSVRLADMLGGLPPDWPRQTARELAAAATWRRRWFVPVETAVLQRALAIVMVLLTHCDLVLVPGGAHVLLAVAGLNVSRFALSGRVRAARVRRILGLTLATVLPAALWIAGVTAVTGQYRWSTALMLNQVTGASPWSDDWQYWFLECLTLALLLLAATMSFSRLAEVHDRYPFGFAMALTVAALALRYVLVGVEAGPTERYWAPAVLWCLALGLAAAAARRRSQSVLVAGVAIVATYGFFGDGHRELVVALGIGTLACVTSVPVPRPLVRVVVTIGAASYWIYVTHWQVYPGLEDAGQPVLGFVASITVGLVADRLYRWISSRSRRRGEGAARGLLPDQPVHGRHDRLLCCR